VGARPRLPEIGGTEMKLAGCLTRIGDQGPVTDEMLGNHLVLNRVLIFLTEPGPKKTILNSAEELGESLLNILGLNDAEAQGL
jgi:hypothetical protein